MVITGPSSVTAGSSAQYVARLEGRPSLNVIWQVNSVASGDRLHGTISASGLYTAPAVLPSGGVVISAVDGRQRAVSNQYAVALVTPQIAVSITGPSTVSLGGSSQFYAAVQGSADQSVIWQVNGVLGGNAAAGTITGSGLYYPPATVAPVNQVVITGFNVAQGILSNAATLTVLQPVPLLFQETVVASSGDGRYLLDVKGGPFNAASVLVVGGVPLTTTFIYGSELQATVIGPTVGSQQVTIAVLNGGNGATMSVPVNFLLTQSSTSPTAAARFLDQATFGPSAASIQHVQQVGLLSYLAEQLQQPPTLIPVLPTPRPQKCLTYTDSECLVSEWFQVALTANDQLRQRVAFALSELWVTEGVGDQISEYYNLLSKDAFANYSKIMYDVTKAPNMGSMLNMVNSYKNGSAVNQNYARELMQLFTLGPNLLNQDGTLQTDGNGQSIPTYTEAQIIEFARAYTGWTFAPADGSAATGFNSPNWYLPMMPVQGAHDTDKKSLLNGVVLPAGQLAEDDLQAALGNIFHHPNLAPFVSRQLIQHLVTGNPSPDYIGRVAAVFNDNGAGVRGDMAAVISAVLMDPLARVSDGEGADGSNLYPELNGGRLREPPLWLVSTARALNATASGSDPGDPYPYLPLGDYEGWLLGDQIFQEPSVFGFFSPSYVIPQTSVNAPEFGVENTGTIFPLYTMANLLVTNQPVTLYNTITGPLVNIDFGATSEFGQFADDPAGLVDHLSLVLLHNQMPTDMKNVILNTISGIPEPDKQVRVEMAAFLVLTSAQYKVVH